MKNTGFTLIELLMAITILLFIFGTGIAAYVRLNDKQSLIEAGKTIQQYFRSAQIKAKVGDKPSGCVQLNGYSVVAAAINGPVVQLNAVCSNTTYLVNSTTLLPSITLQNAINIQFFVLTGGTNANASYVLSNGSHTYTISVGPGGQTGDGVYQ